MERRIKQRINCKPSVIIWHHIYFLYFTLPRWWISFLSLDVQRGTVCSIMKGLLQRRIPERFLFLWTGEFMKELCWPSSGTDIFPIFPALRFIRKEEKRNVRHDGKGSAVRNLDRLSALRKQRKVTARKWRRDLGQDDSKTILWFSYLHSVKFLNS